jgi:hypothetical protein
MTKSISKTAISESGKANPGCVRLFLLVWSIGFGGAGVFFFWLSFLSPILNSRAAMDWPQTECTILSSKVEVQSGEDGGSTYHAKLEYEYLVDGVQYQNDRYSFDQMNGSSDYANQVVRQNGVGTKQVCFYDPAQPSHSTLVRELKQTNYWFVLFPLLFITVGSVVFWIAVFKMRPKKKTAFATEIDKTNFAIAKKSSDSKDDPNPADLLDQEWAKPQKLKSGASPSAKFLITLGISIFWNGIVSIFLYQFLFESNELWVKIFMGLFLTPFVLIGLVMIGAAVYTFMAIFNPKIEIAMSTGAVPLGEEVDIAWEVVGKASRIRHLNIEVQGQQLATFRRGTSDFTDTEIFERIPICDIEAQPDIQFGSVNIVIPEATMHTFEANKNKVTWTIVVSGKIPWWPDVTEEFPFRVSP